MIQYNTLNQDNEYIILYKAKSKNDGVYSFRGVAYRVVNRTITHFAYDNQILERAFGMNVIVGKYTGYKTDDSVKALKGLK